MPWDSTEPKTIEKTEREYPRGFNDDTEVYVRGQWYHHFMNHLCWNQKRCPFGLTDSQALSLINEMCAGFQPSQTPLMVCFGTKAKQVSFPKPERNLETRISNSVGLRGSWLESAITFPAIKYRSGWLRLDNKARAWKSRCCGSRIRGG